MHIEKILGIITDIFDSCYPGLAHGELPTDLKPFLDLERTEAIRIVLRTRSLLDETVPILLALTDRLRSSCIFELPREARFSLLDRLTFAYNFLGSVRNYELQRHTIHSYRRMPSFLIALLTERYKTDVLFSCLSFGTYPYLWKTFVKIN